MCGILGAHGITSVPQAFDLRILKHRGPDHIDSVKVNNTVLGHTRLSIVDVAGGDQPLKSPDGRFWLIANGEIYNHHEIREQFSDYAFQTETDSEVILALFEHYGTEAIKHLDGMFAFVVYDTQTDAIYLGRDPIGIKPLYYGWKGDILYFASEIKALQEQVNQPQEFPPGHWFTREEGFVPFYDLERVAYKAAIDEPSSINDIGQALQKAVKKRLMSDVPLGVYLSGGLDSTIVAALVAQEKPDVHSFAVGMVHSEDLKNARRAAEVLKTQHHEYIYTESEMLEALPTVIYYLESYDPLLIRSALPNYFLARMTREYVTVVLTGEGADELYAGYHYLKQVEDEQALNDEIVNLTNTLYNCNLQRCDRMTMAHSIEARVPFLDTEFIKVSMGVTKDQKIEPETQTEKWALRKAFEDIVPDHVAWRVKQQFSQGAGSSHILEKIANDRYDDFIYAQEIARIQQSSGVQITSKEMLMYYQIFEQQFTNEAARLVQVWQGQDVVPAI